jgi:hypothetical protein
MPIGSRLARLEKRLGVGAPPPDEDAEYELVPVEEWIELRRDLRELGEEIAERNDHWRRVHENRLADFEADEAEAAAIGPGGFYRRCRLSEAAERQIDKILEGCRRGREAELDAARAKRRARRAPWPAPFRLEGFD